MGYWREIDHTADLALQIYGQDLADLFMSAAMGMSQLIALPDTTKLGRSVPIVLTAPDVETLLVDWLNELLYLGEIEAGVFTEGNLTNLSPLKLEGLVHIHPVAEYRTYVKAATYHNLRMHKTANGYTTTIVFDT